MAKSLPSHIEGLRDYLSQPNERNEDLALSYFRHVYGKNFKRQSDAKGSDGYVAGKFVLELKGKTNDWLSGLFQGLAYQNVGLDFSQVVVAAKGFLAIWRVSDIPYELREEIRDSKGAPNAIGKAMAKKYAKKKNDILGMSSWYGKELSGDLFLSQNDQVVLSIKSFEKTLSDGQKMRRKITPSNFTTVLKQMKDYFDPKQPIKAARAFYTMLYAWNETSTVLISSKIKDQVTIGGETVNHLITSERNRFKDFVESHFISLTGTENADDFFARYDEALDAVDPEFRIKHGIFFTDLNLSKYVMWLVKQHIPNLGKNYLVVDPACGSGNLVTNWRSPLELRHKVVSEIEPELLFAVEQRMKGDKWHDGKFTVVPKVSENRGLNFLDRSAEEYLEVIKEYLDEKGQKPDKPIAFLCNPPYRNDDDQTAKNCDYNVHPSIIELTGNDTASERYCCFLAQMKLICDQAKESGLPEESVLLLFTETSWLNRPMFLKIRREIASTFQDVGGVMVNAKEFFDVSGKFPIAFTMWKFKGVSAGLDPDRPIPLKDLTWLKKDDLVKLPWEDPNQTDKHCREYLEDDRSISVNFDPSVQTIRSWSTLRRYDFIRSRRKDETSKELTGGLPKGDFRQTNKKAYGEAGGKMIGFMDDLGPVRTDKSVENVPWFRLDLPFMDCQKSRCLSGMPDQKAFYPSNDLELKTSFLWYALARTLRHCGYPIWAHNCELWAPVIPKNLENEMTKLSYAIAFAENDCVETRFPANNPVRGVPELVNKNPMNPLIKDSYWCKKLSPNFSGTGEEVSDRLVKAVEDVFKEWKKQFKNKHEIDATFKKAYFIGPGILTEGSGILQIRDYAIAEQDKGLLAKLEKVQTVLKEAKEQFYKHLISKNGLNYFAVNRGTSQAPVAIISQKVPSRFDLVLERRKSLASLAINELKDDENLGSVKLAKIMFISDQECELDLEAKYVKDVAGPMDGRMFYNSKIGLFPDQKSSNIGTIVEKKFKKDGKTNTFKRILPSTDTTSFAKRGSVSLGDKLKSVMQIIKLFKPLSTDHSEAVATLYACWNELLVSKKKFTDDDIIQKFYKWSKAKKRFKEEDLHKTLKWMRAKKLVPKGKGSLISSKASREKPDTPF